MRSSSVPPKVVIIGASSGMGYALAEQLAKNRAILGLAARREEPLKQLQAQWPNQIFVQPLDLAQLDAAMLNLRKLIDAMGGMDVLVLNAGISHRNSDWCLDQSTIQVNVLGFVAMARVGFDHFANQGHGHLVGISSIAGIRGRGENLVYSASKAFVSNYLQGLRQKAWHQKLKIHVTEILPGWVDTPLIRGKQNVFWVCSAKKAAKNIARAMQYKQNRVYITKRWWIIAWFLRLIPDWIHKYL